LPTTSATTGGSSIAVDSTSLYITGLYSSIGTVQIYTIGLPPAVVSGRTLPIGNGYMFALKYNLSTGALVSYTYLIGGTGGGVGQSIVANSSGHVHITGRIISTGTSSINRMSLTPAASGRTLDSASRMFVLKYPKT
jgi:hypothetical protein